MSEFLRQAIRDGNMISAARRRDRVKARLEQVAEELNAGRVPAGVIVCRR